MEEITFNDFTKIDLRIAKIIKAEEIQEADKLVKLELDLGELGLKTVFAGIKKFYTTDQLINRFVVCVNNLQPRQMTFGVSEGMILASGEDDLGVFLLSPDKGAKPGMVVK